MSRSLVGSSSSSRSAGSSISRAISTRACSPPESRPDRRLELLGAEQEALGPAGDVDASGRWKTTASPCGRERALAARPRGRGASGAGRTSRPCRFGACSTVPASGRLEAGQQAQQRGLAAAVRAEQAEAQARARARGRGRARSRRSPKLLRQALRRPAAAWSCARSPRSRCRPRPTARARVEVAELVLQPPRLVDARLGLARAGLAPCARATPARRARGCAATPGRRPAPASSSSFFSR